MELQEAVTQFLFHCRYEKNLSPKTLKAYSIDLRQFREYLATNLEIATLAAVDKTALRAYIKTLFGPLKEKSVKRKVATLKALFHFLEREDAIAVNPFRKMDVRIKEIAAAPAPAPFLSTTQAPLQTSLSPEAGPPGPGILRCLVLVPHGYIGKFLRH
jgi:integrase/recombinase XerD